jgi:hypothetical protein
MTTKIKEAMFYVFGDLLEQINSKANPAEVLEWKRSTKTFSCYKRLFTNADNSEDTFMAKILGKIWPSEDATNEQVAYAIAVCQTILDKKYEKITISESVVKNKIARNLVSINYHKQI